LISVFVGGNFLHFSFVPTLPPKKNLEKKGDKTKKTNFCFLRQRHTCAEGFCGIKDLKSADRRGGKTTMDSGNKKKRHLQTNINKLYHFTQGFSPLVSLNTAGYSALISEGHETIIHQKFLVESEPIALLSMKYKFF